MPPSPAGIAVNSKGVIAVADLDGHCIQVFDETEKFVRKLGSPGHMDGQFDFLSFFLSFDRPIEFAFGNVYKCVIIFVVRGKPGKDLYQYSI